MAIRGHEVAALLSPSVNPAAGSEAMFSGIINALNEQRRRKEFDDQLALTRKDSESQDAKRRADIRTAKTNAYTDIYKAMAQEERMNRDLSLRERQQQGSVLSNLDEMIAKSPTQAKAYVASQGMLAPPKPGTLSPETDALLASIGAPGKPGDGGFGVMAGGQQFDVSPEGLMVERSLDVQNLFAEHVGTVPEEKQPIAQMVADMAPEAVRTMSGDKEKAAQFLAEQYRLRSKEHDDADKKTRKRARSGRMRLDSDDYRMFKKDSFGEMQKAGYNSEIKVLHDMNKAKKFLASGNPQAQWTGVRFLLSLQGEGSRPSDFDVRMTQGFKSWVQEAQDFFKKGAVGTLSEKTLTNLLKSLDMGMGTSHSKLRGLYDQAMGTYNTAMFDEERAALNTVVETLFNKPYFSWYKPTGFGTDGRSAPAKRQRDDGSLDAAKILEDYLGELEDLVKESE